MYNYMYHANRLITRIMNTLVGIEATMPMSVETRKRALTELGMTLTQLEPMISDVSK
jgi:hypothetical protein